MLTNCVEREIGGKQDQRDATLLLFEDGGRGP